MKAPHILVSLTFSAAVGRQTGVHHMDLQLQPRTNVKDLLSILGHLIPGFSLLTHGGDIGQQAIRVMHNGTVAAERAVLRAGDRVHIMMAGEVPNLYPENRP